MLKGYYVKFKDYQECFDAHAKGMKTSKPHFDRKTDAVTCYIPSPHGGEDLYFHETAKTSGIDPQRAVDRVVEEIFRKNIVLGYEETEIRDHKVIPHWLHGHMIIHNGQELPLMPSARIEKRIERQRLMKDLKELLERLEDMEDGIEIYGLPVDEGFGTTKRLINERAEKLLELI